MEVKEHRQNPRYRFSCDAEVIDIQGNTRIIGRVTDIARRGCYVDCISPFPPGTLLAVKIRRGFQTFETRATWCIQPSDWGWVCASPLLNSPRRSYSKRGWVSTQYSERTDSSTSSQWRSWRVRQLCLVRKASEMKAISFPLASHAESQRNRLLPGARMTPLRVGLVPRPYPMRVCCMGHESSGFRCTLMVPRLRERTFCIWRTTTCTVQIVTSLRCF